MSNDKTTDNYDHNTVQDDAPNAEQATTVGKSKKSFRLKLLLIAAIVIAAIILVCVILDAINDATATSRVQAFLDGKAFVREGLFTEVYIFNGDTLGTEYWDTDDRTVRGDMNEAYPYEVNGWLLDGDLRIEYKRNGTWQNGDYIVLHEDGSVTFEIGDWKMMSAAELATFKQQTLCVHAFPFASTVVKQKATCTTPGETAQTCRECGYVATQTTAALGHVYNNKVCTRCGNEKPAEKVNLDANTWYTYEDGILRIQNCLVTSTVVVNRGKAMSVTYYAVCQHCHTVNEELGLAGPEVNYEFTKIHTCDACNGRTTVRMKLS